jgi:glycosyltransferase involved in cell wall biosynthesis
MGAEPTGAGAWLRRLKLDEFVALNWLWLGEDSETLTRAEALRRFHLEGVARLAPLAFDAVFDPAYYREVHPEYAELDDEAAYRRWLFVDLELGWPGSPGEHLRRMGLELDAFPDGFDWQGYAQSEGVAENRWFALQHLLNVGVPEVGFPAEGEAAIAFATALGLAYRGRDDRSAAAGFEHARWRGDRSYLVTHQLADTRFRREEWPKALRLFQEAAAHPDAGEVWTYVNGARAALRLGAYRAALDLLRAGQPHVAGQPAWREAVLEIIEALFAARTRRARMLYRRPEGRARADRRIERLLDQVGRLWEELDPIGAPLGPSPDGRIVVLANPDIPACWHYRVEQKVEQLRLLGRPCEVFRPEDWRGFIAALPGAAAAVIFRLPAWPTVIRAISTARNMGVPTIYDIDDLIFDAAEYPEPIETYGGLLPPADYEAILFGVPLFRHALGLCDYGMAPTTALARAMQPLVRTGRVFVLPNGLDSRNDPFLALPPRAAEDEAVTIFYGSGTRAHNADWDTLAGPAVLDLMEADPRVRLTVVGHLALRPEFERVADRISRLPHQDDMARFWALLRAADINLAVLQPTWATEAKSEIKWLEAAVQGIPSVVSATETYRAVVDHGQDGLLAATVGDWREALGRLAADPALRRSMGEFARAKAKAGYALTTGAERLATALAEVEAARPLVDPRPCILLANVWFHPQFVGGAARVVRDNLDAWIESGAAERFRFAVLTTDDGAGPDYALRVDAYRGVPVTRIAIPQRPGMDWAYEDLEVRRIFGDLLQMLRPELVHLHAVQRLTASLAEACQAARTPYLVTPHDAWWLSDWHFLVDEAGKVRTPGEPALIDPPPGVTPTQSRERSRRLRAALDGAAAVFGVSSSFADLHREAGVAKVLAVPNGAPSLPRPARVPSPSGRVRLAHVGNVARHKGHHLVEAALRAGRFEHLELTVIDHARAAGNERVLTWGATPVRVVGRAPPERMSDFYARHDVLLSPSIWPESFGLVTREALTAGLWVAGGDRGAMAEDVTAGVNGWTVDVSSPAGLFAVLSEIDADPARFLQSPAGTPTLRTAADQAGELLGLYARVLAGDDLFAAPAPRAGLLSGLIAGRRGRRR